jgi:enterochelin esterase-like enzyme
VAAPKATHVTLAGEFARGDLAMSKDDAGVWSVTVGPIEPETYHYTFSVDFSVDGLRILDPGNPNVKTGSTVSTIQSILEVRGDAAAFYDGKPVPHGLVRTHWYHSRSLNTLRRVTIYTPPGYERDTTSRYPVPYLFHGADETVWIRLGRANLILDNLIAEGKVKPFLVVMPFGYAVPPGSPGGELNTAKFGEDLLGDVIPLVESSYRVYANRDRRAIVWIGCGKDDGVMPANRAFAELLAANNVQHTFRETEGAHTWTVWRRYLREIAPLLFQ